MDRTRMVTLAAAAVLLWALIACSPPAPEAAPPPAEHAQHHENHGGGDAQVRALLEGASVASAQSTPSAWRALRADVGAGRLTLDEHGVPEDFVPVASKLSDDGHFRVSLEAPEEGVQINRLLRYVIRVEDADGAPVADADLDFVGGMPLHDHGFPTSPAIGEALAPGRYPLEGIRFGMKGWWQLVLSIGAGEVTDTVTFDIAVSP